jgi:hypothetical protein
VGSVEGRACTDTSNYQPVPGTVTVTARDGKGGTAVLHINFT